MVNNRQTVMHHDVGMVPYHDVMLAWHRHVMTLHTNAS
jgi:hypothetical protein